MTENESRKSSRLASLDALRGFDMFFITGGAALICALCKFCGGCNWLAAQMKHVPWAGLAHHDTIFPLFLFLAGVSWPFSLAAQRARGSSPLRIHLKLLRRVVILFLFGLSLGGILKWNPNFRLSSVLGFIGLSWGIAALLFYHVETSWKRWTVFAAIAVGYFALLHFGVAPGAPAGADTYSRQWNIIASFDRVLWPNHLYVKGVYDPESLMSLPGGILIALLGMSAGSLLKSGLTPSRKTLALFAAAVASLVIDLVLVYAIHVPIVKALWTVSFVFAAAAYSFAMLALFYWIVDVRGWRKWTLVFDPVGKNSILAYMFMCTGLSWTLQHFLFGGTLAHAGAWEPVLKGLTAYLVVWSVTYCLSKKGVFLKV